MQDGVMKTYLPLTSPQNPRIKQAIHLRERKERDQSDTFLIEGYRELLRAIEQKQKIETLFISPELFLGENEGKLIEKIAQQGAQIFQCPKNLFQKISYRDRPDGLLGIAKQFHLTFKDLKRTFKTEQAPLLVIAEAIEKPGNLGTILRSSDAVGVDGVIVCDRCTDIFNPNVVRASVGTLFTIPVLEAEGQKTLSWLKEQGIYILAATPSATQVFTEIDMTKPLAIAVGTEQLGLSKLWMESADLQVKIPMHGVADSLNVAMATTLLLYEANRQRRNKIG